MNCPEYERKTENEAQDVFTWSELPPMPVLYKKDGEESSEEENGERRFLSRRIRKLIIQIAAVSLEVCILAAVIGGVYLWQQRSEAAVPLEPENIVYSSEDIVMMLVKQRDKWSFQKPDDGYTSCCFLDMDFDGSPEFLSISYDRETARTDARIYRVRSCTLEEIEIVIPDEGGFFDVGQQLSLCYHPDTNEMLYISSDMRRSEDSESAVAGSFFIHENKIQERYYFRETAVDGNIEYEVYDDTQKPQETLKADYFAAQRSFSGKLTDLKLRYEWVQNSGDISALSNQKLAALLLRSYDSFSYDTSGLALQ